LVYAEEALSGAEIIARTIRGSPCGFLKSLGRGSIIHVGTWLGFDTEGHKGVYEAVLQKSGARLRQASSDNGNIVVRERFTDNHEALLFIGNYYNEEQEGRIWYTHPETGETIAIPYASERALWPPLYGVLTPVCLEVSDGLKILHCTSDILALEEEGGQIRMTLSGDRDLPGELVLEGPASAKIWSVLIDGEETGMVRANDRVALLYDHRHKKEMILEIKSL
jgi:hypothetical protein